MLFVSSWKHSIGFRCPACKSSTLWYSLRHMRLLHVLLSFFQVCSRLLHTCLKLCETHKDSFEFIPDSFTVQDAFNKDFTKLAPDSSDPLRTTEGSFSLVEEFFRLDLDPESFIIRYKFSSGLREKASTGTLSRNTYLWGAMLFKTFSRLLKTRKTY